MFVQLTSMNGVSAHSRRSVPMLAVYTDTATAATFFRA
jgi:hypothetical protein